MLFSIGGGCMDSGEPPGGAWKMGVGSGGCACGPGTGACGKPGSGCSPCGAPGT